MPSSLPSSEQLPPAYTVVVPGRGEYVVRDSGGDGPPVLLLHGWMFTADTNWFPVYAPLERAGYRVIAFDHRGHGAGLRTSEPFRLADCADDAAAVLPALDAEPAIAVGYSMGGAIAQLLARRHPDVVSGLVMCATAADWQDWRAQGVSHSMALTQLWFGMFPDAGWRCMLASAGVPEELREWLAAELSRGSSIDLTEAGHELSRYDARPWIGELRGIPAASVITTRDRRVSPGKQRALAGALGATVCDVHGDHFAVATEAASFAQALVHALEATSLGSEPLLAA